MNNENARILVEGLFAHYPSFRPQELHIQVFARALEDMSEEVARAAIARVTRVGKPFPPSVPELLAACVANARGERRSGEEAYTELMVAVRRFGRCYGGSKPPEFNDPIMARCIGVWGSWNNVCNSPEDDAAGRARFIQLYNSLAEKDDQHAVLPQNLRVVREFGFAASTAIKRLPEPTLRKPPTVAELAAFDAEVSDAPH